MKVNVNVKMLKNLGNKAIENGTEKFFIPIALEWIEAANKELDRLNAFIVEAERKAREIK